MSQSTEQRVLTISLAILLLISVAYNLVQINSHSETVITYDNKVDSMIVVRVDLERELSSVEMEMEKYRGMASNLDSLLNDATIVLAEREKKIRSLLAREKDNQKLTAQLKKELGELRKMRDDYLERIDQLITENNILKEQNEQLNISVQNLNEEKRNLSHKVATASELKAEYLKVASFKKKNSGKFVESAIASRTNKLEVCFTIMDNKVAPMGDRMLYVVITEPTGKILAGYSKAEFVDSKGELMSSTLSQRIKYDGQKQNACLSFETDDRILTPGSYIIDVYCEGTLVANTAYILK